MVYRYALCVAALALVWFGNVKRMAQGVRERNASEVYMHAGLGIFLTLPVVELTLHPLSWLSLDMGWLRGVGWLLFLPAVYLEAASHRALERKGDLEGDALATTTFVDTGVYGVVRQPMTLGMFIWSIALMLVFQTLFSLILAVLALWCFWMSARNEAEHDVQKFGAAYQEYMRRVPMWNFLKRPRK